jgi:hypothetical protein
MRGITTFIRPLASGAIAEARISDGLVIRIFPPDPPVGVVEDEPFWDEPPTCPICDAFGCGGDGLGCYQYEGRGRWDAEDERERLLEMYDRGLTA